jgi:hypothetical protein
LLLARVLDRIPKISAARRLQVSIAASGDDPATVLGLYARG